MARRVGPTHPAPAPAPNPALDNYYKQGGPLGADPWAGLIALGIGVGLVGLGLLGGWMLRALVAPYG
jgi:hypothetical protein